MATSHFGSRYGGHLRVAGDARGFTPYAGNTGRSRVEQEVTVDFTKRRLSVFAGTGVTVLKMTDANGNVQDKEGKASTEGVSSFTSRQTLGNSN
ncbi:DUF3238 domain-containing protein [Brevibacillus nitrificans]|uniref:DUF3238 domain-containing protein n=1 Tax=Brevibacillus nitrificans TaxID=651560 RepID=UPI00399D45DF